MIIIIYKILELYIYSRFNKIVETIGDGKIA